MIYKYIFYDFFKNYKMLIVLWIFFILFFYIFQIGFIPFMIGKMTTNITLLKNEWSFNYSKMNTFTYLIILLGILFIIVIIEKIKNIMESNIESKYLLYLRKLIFDKILLRYSTNFKDVNKADIITRLITISNGIWDSIYIFKYNFSEIYWFYYNYNLFFYN